MKRLAAVFLSMLASAAMAQVAPPAISDQLTLYSAPNADGNRQIIRQITVYEDGSFDGIGAIGCLMQTPAAITDCTSDFGEGQPGAGVLKYYYLSDLPVTGALIAVFGPGEELSDVVGSARNATIGFVSDGDGALGDLSVFGNLQFTGRMNEADGVLDVTAVLDTSNMPGALLTFFSDAETIPEPAGLALVGLGLLGIVARRRCVRA